MAEARFWQTKTLAEMNDAEWEALCDGCGKCCLVKLQDDDSGEISYTDLACQLLDTDSCRCLHYQRRLELVPDCVKLTKENLSQIDFMPPSCAYRLLNEGKPLPDWHPLISGDANSTMKAGKSVKGRVRPETLAGPALENHIVDWPLEEK